MAYSDLFDFSHWKYKLFKGDCAILWSPTIHEGKACGYRIKREILKQLKDVQITMKLLNYKRFVIYTEIQEAHIIKLLTKIDCVPYEVHLETNTIWFRKEL